MASNNKYDPEMGGTPISIEELGITEEQWKAYMDLFCNCEEPDDHPRYKPDGVDLMGCTKHGWVCRKCNKFVQIG